MAKRSKRRTARQNKDQAGCMWGLISIFDFRNGRTTKRLLSDRRHVTKNTVDPTSEVNLLTSSEEKHITVENIEKIEKTTFDVFKMSVKELMEEEMIIEQDSTKQTDFDSEHTEKTSKKPLDIHELDINHQVSSQKNAPYRDLEALMKEILLVYQRKNDRVNDLETGSTRAFSVLEEKINSAVEVFMNETSSDRAHQSKDFIDVFQMLGSNKELFLKLLQDQNSIPNDINPNPLENGPGPDGPVARKPRNFFRRRSKSHEIISLTGNESPFPSNRIVILKPGSPNNERTNSSHFSFMEIKKRLKNVIGKDQPKTGRPETSSTWSSPNRDHFYTERFSKRVSKLREPETKQTENGDTSQRISNIYIEAKKHLSEMLSGGDEDTNSMIERLPKTLGGILSLSEYNSGSPGSSPKKDNENGFVTAQMRLDPRADFIMDIESQPCSTSVDLEEKSDVCDEVSRDTSSGKEDMSCEEVLEIEKLENQEEMEVVDISCEQCSSSGSIDDNEHREIVEESNKEKSPNCSKSDLRGENENSFSSPTESRVANKTKEPESSNGDKTELPSPVSVLQPLFSDNEISPSSTVTRHAETSIQPRCLNFDDQETCTRNCTENEESAFEYVEAVLLASDLNWDDFENRWLSSIEILDPSLFEEVEIFTNRPYHDQKLLFDSTNEILDELCDCYLDLFLELSFIKRNVKPVPNGMNLINEVWERIETRLYNDHPRSLDQLVKEDLGVSRTWMDLRLDNREIVFEIDELIFDDMIDDALLTLVNDDFENERLVVDDFAN